jgi:hypothetical protein
MKVDQLGTELMDALHDGSMTLLKDAFLRIDDMVRAGTPTPEIFRWLLKDALDDTSTEKLVHAAVSATATMYLYRAYTMIGSQLFEKEEEK